MQEQQLTALSKADVVSLFKLFTTLFPQSAKNFTNVDALSRDIWFEMLKDIPREKVMGAVKKLAATNVFAPSIAEIREVIIRAEKPENFLPAHEAWGIVYKAIAKYGRMNPQGAFADMPEPVSRCARAIGWANMCMSENIEVLRGQFCKAWEEQAKRDLEQMQTPETVNKALGGGNGSSLLQLPR